MTVTMPRTVHVEHCMGTVFTIDIREPGEWEAAVRATVTWLHHVDAVFSTYKPDSDISRMQRRELRLSDADPDVARVLELCAQVQATTGGAFTAMNAGRVDPTGLVKGWAIEQAGRILLEHGARNHAVNGGGDMQLCGEAGPGRPWTVGIADPENRAGVLALVHGRNLAVATSGTAERGAHILDPFAGTPATGVISATVLGPSLTFADAYATAAVVLGRDAIRWIEGVPHYEVMVLDAGGELHSSSGWRRSQASAD